MVYVEPTDLVTAELRAWGNAFGGLSFKLDLEAHCPPGYVAVAPWFGSHEASDPGVVLHRTVPAEGRKRVWEVGVINGKPSKVLAAVMLGAVCVSGIEVGGE